MPSTSISIEPKGRIPVTLVTGFLGSGKTTLINTALRSPELAHTAVIVNEFGEVGLDHKLFARSSDSVIVLENGCLCCTVRSDLVGTLNTLFRCRQSQEIPFFDHVVIETSGLAEPGPVLQAFLSEPTLDGLFRVTAVVALVDAVNWFDSSEAHDECVRQAALADRILITKLDLLAEERGALESRLRQNLERINPSAVIEPVDWSTPAVAALLTSVGFDAADSRSDPRPWLKVESYEHSHAPSRDHHDNDHDHGHEHLSQLRDGGVESFVLTRNDPLSREELQLLLDGITQNLGAGLLRVKGLINIAEEPGRPAVIQGAQHLLHTMTWLERWPDADQRTQIVFITQGITRNNLKEVIDLLDRVAARTFRARARGRGALEASRSAPGS